MENACGVNREEWADSRRDHLTDEWKVEMQGGYGDPSKRERSDDETGNDLSDDAGLVQPALEVATEELGADDDHRNLERNEKVALHAQDILSSTRLAP